jgi:uncharacterized lipoprotein YmbA
MRPSIGTSTRAIAWALSLAALIGASCQMPGRASTPLRYWVLEPVSGAPAEAEVRTVLGVGPFDFPAYLERAEVVSRVGENQLRVSDLDRWGATLDQGFKHVLARNLEILVPGVVTQMFPWKGAVEVEYRLTGSVSRFEVKDDRAAHLTARFAIERVADGVAMSRGAWNGEEPLDDPSTAASVAALSRALEGLSREIARALAALD